MIIDISILIRNSNKLDNSINKEKIVILPIKLPKRSFFKLVCLLNITPVAKSNNKSNRKFKSKTKSIYIFISITKNIIKKI